MIRLPKLFLAPLLLTALLAGCAVDTVAAYLPGAEVEPDLPPPLPPEVVAALPPGTASSVVFTDLNGCYLYSIEVTVPPSGYPVRDAAGNQICPGQPVAMVAPVTGVAPSASALVVTPLDPVTPAPVAPASGLNMPVSSDIAAMAGANG